MLGHPVTGSCHALGFGPLVYQQESRHLAGTATHLQLQHLIGVNFPFLTSGPLFIFPGRTCFPGDNSDASSPPKGDSRAQLSIALQPPSNPPPVWRRMGRSPSTGLGAMGLDPSRAPAGRDRPPFGEPVGTCQRGLHPGCTTAPGPFSARPRVSKRGAFLLLPEEEEEEEMTPELRESCRSTQGNGISLMSPSPGASGEVRCECPSASP